MLLLWEEGVGMTSQQIKIIIAGSLAMITVAFATSSVSYFIIPVTEELSIGRGAFTLHYSIMTIVSTITLPFFSGIIERLGIRKIVFLSGIGLFIGFCVFAFSHSIWHFYLAAAFIGLFYYASTTLVALTLINRWFTEKKGIVTGIVMAGSGIGGVLLGLIIPPILASIDWRTTYVFMGGVMLITTIPSALFLIKEFPESQQSNSSKTLTDNYKVKPRKKRLFCNGTFIFSYVAICFFSIAVSFIQHLPSMIVGKGFTLTQAGYLLSILYFSMIFLKIIIGWLTDRLGTKIVLFNICVIYALGFMMLPGDFGFLLMSICMLVLGVGKSAATVIFPLYATTIYNVKYFTIIWGVLGTAITVGNALGSTIWGYVFDIFGKYDCAVMAVAIGIIIVGLVLVNFIKRSEVAIYENTHSHT
jgi:MFS family permease